MKYYLTLKYVLRFKFTIIVRVMVTAEPGLPYIRQATDADVVEVVEGEPVVLDCVSPGAR